MIRKLGDEPSGCVNAPGSADMAGLYSIRGAKPEDQRSLTRLCVRATTQSGYDEAFIDRAMPALTITVPLITGDYVRVAEDKAGETVGVVTVTPTALRGIALLHHIFVDPPFWKRGVGRALFAAAVTRAKELQAGALMIYAEPSAEGFYQRMGAIGIGDGPFVYSPELRLPRLLYIFPRDA
jgi:GNAT superfamily N-acetyltransferase